MSFLTSQRRCSNFFSIFLPFLRGQSMAMAVLRSQNCLRRKLYDESVALNPSVVSNEFFAVVRTRSGSESEASANCEQDLDLDLGSTTYPEIVPRACFESPAPSSVPRPAFLRKNGPANSDLRWLLLCFSGW